MIYPDSLDDFVWFDNALRQKDIQETKIMQEENVQETILNPFIFDVKGNGLSPDSFEDNSRQQHTKEDKWGRSLDNKKKIVIRI